MSERNKSYIFERTTSPAEIQHLLNSWAYAVPTAMRYWWRMLDRRGMGSVFEGFRNRQKGENPIEHALEGGQFALDLVMGHKAANGLRAGALTHNMEPNLLSVFGLDLTYGMNHTDFSDHAVPHVRRVHRVSDHIVLRVPELRHSASIRRWLPALELFPHNHDMDQVLTLMRNKTLRRQLERAGRMSEYPDFKLSSKTGHAIAASVMTMAMNKRYAQESGLTDIDLEKARNITMAAALMIAKHDEPDSIKQAFAEHDTNHRLKRKGTDHRYTSGKTNIEKLVRDFDNNRVDLFTLSPRQLIQILMVKKNTAGFTTADNIYGLHPNFVQEYAKELEGLSHDNTPMFSNITQDERLSFMLASEVAVFADEVEMIYPPYPSIMRSLKTDISRKRQWWKEGATADEILRLIETQGGNYRGELSSDSYRLFWETWEMIHKTQEARERNKKDGGFDLMTAPYVNAIAREHVLLRLFAMREFGAAIMTKGEGEIIDQIYADRQRALSRKAIRRSKKIESSERAGLRKRLDSQEILKALRNSGEGTLEDHYGFRLRMLAREAEEMKTIIREKPVTEYDAEDTQTYIELCDRLIGYACSVYQVSEKEAEKIRRKLKQSTDFYSTYDPLGGLPDTIREPEHFSLWQQLLGGDIRGDAFWDLRNRAQEDEIQFYTQQTRIQQKKRSRGITL